MKIAERRAALGKGPVHLYYFTWETPVQGGRLHSPHTMEIPFAFDNVQISRALTGGGADAMALADKVSDDVDRVRAHGRPEHAQAAALAGLQCHGPAHHGDQQSSQGGERSDS